MIRILLLCSFLALFGLGGSTLVLLRALQRQQVLAERLAAVAAQHGGARDAAPPSLLRLVDQQQLRGAMLALAAVFGFDPEHPDLHPARWWLVLLAASGIAWYGAGLAAGLIGWAAYLAMPLASIWLSRNLFAWWDRRRTDVLYRQFPDALAMIVRSVRVGIPVGEALRLVSREIAPPTGLEFARLADQIAIGMPMEEALHRMSRRNKMPEYRFFATALALQSQTGGGLAETLDNLAEVIRKRVALKARGMALASEANTSAGILAALPLIAGLGLWFMNPAYLSLLFTDPGGQHVLSLAILLLGAGLFVMRTTIRRSLS
uniref:Type II secretion system protein F n=1 Tax=Acidicaldus sp. TaxID=1872105 RepID=A0A8J4M7K8_9PROT